MEASTIKPRLYWVAKVFISFFMVFSAYFSFTHADDFRKLGFPDYFRAELSIAKIIGAVLLWVPAVPFRVRDWIYAGFIIAMVSALIAHISSHDPLSRILFVVIDLALILLCMRYVSRKEQPLTIHY